MCRYTKIQIFTTWAEWADQVFKSEIPLTSKNLNFLWNSFMHNLRESTKKNEALKFSNLCLTWSTYGLFVVILGNVFPDLEIRMSEHALKVSCGPQPIALVPFGQLPHELAVLYVHWKYFITIFFSSNKLRNLSNKCFCRNLNTNIQK